MTYLCAKIKVLELKIGNAEKENKDPVELNRNSTNKFSKLTQNFIQYKNFKDAGGDA